MTENDERLRKKLATLAVDAPVMVVGTDGRLGTDTLAGAIAKARESGVEIILLDEPPKPDIEKMVMTISAPKALTEPAPVYRPEREWWRGINPRRQRRA